MQQAHDFLSESDALAAVLEKLPGGDWERATQFKDWTINDVIVHLHYWNVLADMSMEDPDGFRKKITEAFDLIKSGGLRPLENAEVKERGKALYDIWVTRYRDMSKRWAEVDPKLRVAWAGPDMSARSAITARQMETWAHGQEVFDLLGIERTPDDRIRNVVVLGVNAFGWSHKVHGMEVPEKMPKLILTAPSGEVWEYGDDESAGTITGPAYEFAQVVTQTRNIKDTTLAVEGEIATRWMETAQCFAGPPETPPPPGTRHRAD